MKHSILKANRLAIWGDGLLNKLKSLSRKRRKRLASKKRRTAQREQQRRDGRNA